MNNFHIYIFLLLQYVFCYCKVESTELLPEVTVSKTELCGREERSTFLWSVRSPKSNTHSLLFGTIHVPFDQVWDTISPKAKEAIKLVDNVVFELALYDPDTISGLIDCKQLQHGHSLKHLLPQNLYGRLKSYMRRLRQRFVKRSNELGHSRRETFETFNALAGPWETRRPIWLLFLLYQLNDEEHQLKGQSKVPMLDSFLAQMAKENGKTLYSIETASEQCNPLIRVDQDQLIFAINYTLSYLEWAEGKRRKRQESAIDRLVKLYRCGSNEVANFEAEHLADTGFSVNEDFDLKAKEIDQRLKLDIIEHRNIRMAARTHRLIQRHSEESFLFVIGAGHFYGAFSLLNVLRNYGYEVKPVTERTDLQKLIQRSNNFKTFNELWVRRVEDSEVMTMQEDSKQTSINYIYLSIILIPVVILIVRHIGKKMKTVSPVEL